MYQNCRRFLCQHRVEVEVFPALAEVSFRDERFSQPENAIVQFRASVYNAPSSRVTWKVVSVDGGPGAGTIDAAGLYIAPAKGLLPFALTDIVVATSVDDVFRQAFARVAIAGHGPEPDPQPRVEVFPRRVHLYYPQGQHNAYIDASNTMQLFRALVFNADPALIAWTPGGPNGPEFLYQVSGSGAPTNFHVTATLPDGTAGSASVSVLNYHWPGIV
jgi:hypothetical protein